MILVPERYLPQNKLIRGYRYATISSSNDLKIRLDAIEYLKENNRYLLRRMTHFGTIFGNYFTIRDFLVSETDLQTGKIESVESSVANNYDGGRIDELPKNYIDIDGKTDFGYLNANVYKFDKLINFNIRKGKLEDNIYLPIIGDVFEDDFNMEYSRGVGNLAVIITSAQLSVPFRCDIIIDNIEGYNITNVKCLEKDSDVQAIFKKEFKSFTKSIKNISDTLKRDYEDGFNNGDEVDHMRIYCGIREFDSYIRCINVDLDNLEFNFHFNNSDHLRTLLTTMSRLGENFMFENSFNDLMSSKSLLLPDSLFDNDFLRANFLTAREPMNYSASYKE